MARLYSSAAVQELLRAHPESSDPEDIIRGMAADIVDMYISLCDDDPFPLNMEQLASLAGVRVKREILTGGESGQLIPTPDGPVALVNSLEPEVRQNFTIGHEIGHTFFPNYARKKFRMEYMSGFSSGIDDEEEHLCDVAASELLIPTRYFLETLRELPFSVLVLPALADKFGASLEAVALKMTQTSATPCAILVSERCLKPSEQKLHAKQSEQSYLFPELAPVPPVPKLRVKYASVSRSWAHGFIPRYATVPDGSSIHQASVDCQTKMHDGEVISIKDFRGLFRVETFPLDHVNEEGHSVKTFSLLLPMITRH